MKSIKSLLKFLLKQMALKSNYKFLIKDWTRLKDIQYLVQALESKRFSRNLTPMKIEPTASRVLFISPHPDDDILSSGGTMIRLLENECDIKTLYLASGKCSKPTDQQSFNKQSREIIEKEAENIALKLGIDVEFWRNDNHQIKIDEFSKQKLLTVIEKFKPDQIFLPFISDDHDDHRRAVHLFYETLKNRLNSIKCEIWAYQVYSTLYPNVVVDITNEIEKKLELIQLYESQMNSRDWGHFIKGLNAFNSRFIKTNKKNFVETFFVLPIKDFIDLISIYFDAKSNSLYYSDYYLNDVNSR